jgi:peptidoglycan/xylan/chitin deacetylase (PgdA/CDA1 family)
MTGWEELARELDRWPAAGAGFWWRDDDAQAPSPALDRLLALGPQPLAIAVIPAGAQASLVSILDQPRIDVLQHGFSHKNYEPAGAKKAELGQARPAALVIEELRQGKALLRGLFGPRCLPVLVPPWNRIADSVVAGLEGAGFVGLSVYQPRQRHSPGPSRVNTHVDILDWPAGGSFLGVEAVLGLIVCHLSARRRGDADPEEPTGILTHHGRMDEPCFAFLAQLLQRLGQHPAVHWRAARDIFAGGSHRP